MFAEFCYFLRGPAMLIYVPIILYTQHSCNVQHNIPAMYSNVHILYIYFKANLVTVPKVSQSS